MPPLTNGLLVRCFNCLPQAVVAAETVAEVKRKLSNVDLSSF